MTCKEERKEEGGEEEGRERTVMNSFLPSDIE